MVRRRPVLLLALFLAGILLQAAGPPERLSSWKDRDITVDGLADEWSGFTTPLRESRLAVGFVNDASWLYLCLVARDPLTRDQIALRGLVVWLTPNGGAKKKAVGVKFPIPPDHRDPFHRRPEPPGGAGEDQPQAAPAAVEYPGDQGDIEVLADGRDAGQRMRLAEAGGIEARMAIRDGVLAYELKVPLRRSDEHPQGVGAEAGRPLQVEIETPEYRGPVSLMRPAGGTIGITVGGGHRGIGGVYGGYPTANDTRLLMKPLDVKTAVLLASAPAK